jgi:hypothetical protein
LQSSAIICNNKKSLSNLAAQKFFDEIVRPYRNHFGKFASLFPKADLAEFRKKREIINLD